MAASNYKPSGGITKIGVTAPGPYSRPPSGYPQWTASQTWAALGTCYNGGFLFKTVAGGAGAASGNGPSPQSLTDNSCTWVLVGGCETFTASETSPSVEVGKRIEGYDPNYGIGEFEYVKFTGSTAIVAGDIVNVNRAAQTCVQASSGAIATGRGTIGVAMGSHPLDSSTPRYGWVMLRGVHTHANVATGTTTNIFLSLSATAGRASATMVTAFSAVGLIGRVADAASNVGCVEVISPVCAGLG